MRQPIHAGFLQKQEPIKNMSQTNWILVTQVDEHQKKTSCIVKLWKLTDELFECVADELFEYVWPFCGVGA